MLKNYHSVNQKTQIIQDKKCFLKLFFLQKLGYFVNLEEYSEIGLEVSNLFNQNCN